MLAINHNLMASDTAANLSRQYDRLQSSIQKLSSGLRINSAADDSAGLAIRELMRADIAALNQGTRNVNDAISMLQTFDGALSVIDEKLIRMKELAEQAATGTYDSTQRLMIDSEFQAMGEEIDRIARATDFNGIKLLCTPMITWFEEKEKFVPDPINITNPAFSPSATNPPHTNTVTMTKNINEVNEANLNNLINETTPTKTINVVLTALKGEREAEGGKLIVDNVTTLPDNSIQTQYTFVPNTNKKAVSENYNFSIAYVDALGTVNDLKITYTALDPTSDPKPNPAKAWKIDDAVSNAGNQQIELDDINPNDTTIYGSRRAPNRAMVDFSINDSEGNPIDFSSFADAYPDIAKMEIDTKNNTYTITENYVTLNPDKKSNDVFDGGDYTAEYDDTTNTIIVNLKNNGGSIRLKLASDYVVGDEISFDIELKGGMKTVQEPHYEPDPDQKVKIHFGTMNDSAEDYYYINYDNCTREGLGIDGLDIKTQDNAQNALVDINDAIVKKDKVRAKYGTLQNRLENTATNLRIQAENLQTAESRISDADIALEMTQFVCSQILTQSAVAMLAQANSMPQLVMRLIG